MHPEFTGLFMCLLVSLLLFRLFGRKYLWTNKTTGHTLTVLLTAVPSAQVKSEGCCCACWLRCCYNKCRFIYLTNCIVFTSCLMPIWLPWKRSIDPDWPLTWVYDPVYFMSSSWKHHNIRSSDENHVSETRSCFIKNHWSRSQSSVLAQTERSRREQNINNALESSNEKAAVAPSSPHSPVIQCGACLMETSAYWWHLHSTCLWSEAETKVQTGAQARVRRLPAAAEWQPPSCASSLPAEESSPIWWKDKTTPSTSTSSLTGQTICPNVFTWSEWAMFVFQLISSSPLFFNQYFLSNFFFFSLWCPLFINRMYLLLKKLLADANCSWLKGQWPQEARLSTASTMSWGQQQRINTEIVNEAPWCTDIMTCYLLFKLSHLSLRAAFALAFSSRKRMTSVWPSAAATCRADLPS